MKGLKIAYFDVEESKRLLKDFKGQVDGWILVGDKKWMVPARFEKLGSIYYSFKVRQDDTWVVTVPRSGTTWTQEMVWLIKNDLNFFLAKSKPLEERFPYLDLTLNLPESVAAKSINVDEIIELSHERAAKLSSPRFIKSHLPLSLLPNLLDYECKVVYVARNPKDVCVSYYNHYKDALAYDYEGDFENFWNYFKNGLIMYTPYWEHVREAWAQRKNPNFLFLFYEELSQDLTAALKKVAEFFGKSYTDEEYMTLADHLSFKNLKNNEMANLAKYKRCIFNKDNFMREGKMQGWRKMFTPELNAEANQWIEDNLKDTDLRFPYIDIYS